MPASAALDLDRLRSLLTGVDALRTVDWVASTGSTNHDLADVARAGDEGARLLVSEEQTAGRGRFDRRWESPAGACVAVSLMVRPHRPALDWGWLSLLAGMAVATGLERACGQAARGRVQLKWPNDVLVDGRKVCGILSERIDGPAGLRPAAVVGIGINISLDESELPVPHATSLALAGLPADKTDVVAAVAEEFFRLFEMWDERGELHDDYTARCASIGTPLRVMVDERTSVVGLGDHVDEFGRLVVRAGGRLQAFSAGDVFHLRLAD